MYRVEIEILFSLIVLGAYFITLKIFKKYKVKIDKNLLLLFCSIIIIGSSLRVFEDAKIFPRNFFTVTPGIWMLVSLLFFPEYFLLHKKLKLSLRRISAINFVIFILLNFLLLTIIKKLNKYAILSTIPLIPLVFLKDWESFLLFFAFGVDSIVPTISTTFFEYYEKHPLSSKILEINPILYVIVKLSIAFVLYLILKKGKDEERLFVYFTTTVVLGAGMRSFIRFLFLV